MEALTVVLHVVCCVCRDFLYLFSTFLMLVAAEMVMYQEIWMWHMSQTQHTHTHTHTDE